MRRLVALALFAPAVARADATVTITLTPQGQQLAQNLGFTPDMLIAKVNDKITSYYQTANIPNLMTAFADTAAFADRDLGVGYAMAPGQILVGVVAAGAVDSDATFKSSKDKSVTSGEIYNFGIMAGTSLARWGHPRWTVFANGFYEPLAFNGLEGHLVTTGAHAQWRVVPGRGDGAAHWNGVDVTSGLEYATWSMGIAAPIQYKFTVTGTGSSSRNLTLTSTGQLSLDASALTIPVEVTTGVRLGGVLSVYGGAGLDVTPGSSTLTASLAGDMKITSDGTNVGHVVITASGSESPTPFTAHVLGGVQIDVPYVQLYAQALAAPSITTLAVGLRGKF